MFAVHRIDEQLTKAMDRKVWLPSGGTLVIDRTEAMTVVDVNTGKFTGSGGNLEQTVTRNNLEAAEEIVRQLRLRDIGGIIVIDFIDMVLESNRDLVLRRLTEALARDRTRHQVSEVTSLGLVQLTRKKLGTGLIEAFSTTCSHCAGRGIMLHGDPVDSGSATGRNSELRAPQQARQEGGPARRRGPVAKVPVHAAGEHPMFRAMAAATGADHGDEEDGDVSEGAEDTVVEGSEDIAATEPVEEELDDDEPTTTQTTTRTPTTTSMEDDDEDDDDVDVIEVIDDDDSDDDDDEDEDDDDSDDEDDRTTTMTSDDEDADDEQPAAAVGGGRQRRRAAARPAGPPVHDD